MICVSRQRLEKTTQIYIAGPYVSSLSLCSLRIIFSWYSSFDDNIMKPCLLKNFTIKNGKSQIKIFDIFHISAQNIDCGYSLELPQQAVITSTHNLCFLAK